MQLGRQLDERRAVGLRIDAQCVDGLRLRDTCRPLSSPPSLINSGSDG